MAIRTAPTPATERAEATRRQILETAASAFAAHGYRGISLNDIVRESGLTKGAFYFHFPSKEALALAVFRDKQEAWIGRTLSALGQHPRAIDQLEAMLDVGCELYETDSSARAVGRLCHELASEPELRPHSRAHLQTWFDLAEQLILQAQAEGDVRADVDAKTMAATVCSAFIGIEEVSAAISGLTDFRERLEGLRTLVLAALKTRE